MGWCTWCTWCTFFRVLPIIRAREGEEKRMELDAVAASSSPANLNSRSCSLSLGRTLAC